MRTRFLFLFLLLALRSIVFATLRVHFVDVGQGDAVVIESPSGQQVVYDGGPGAQALRDYLTALQARGIPVTSVCYPDEGHGFVRPANELSFNAIAERFLAQVLGGRCEPVGEDFAGSSQQVVVDDFGVAAPEEG